MRIVRLGRIWGVLGLDSWQIGKCSLVDSIRRCLSWKPGFWQRRDGVVFLTVLRRLQCEVDKLEWSDLQRGWACTGSEVGCLAKALLKSPFFAELATRGTVKEVTRDSVLSVPSSDDSAKQNGPRQVSRMLSKNPHNFPLVTDLQQG